MYILSIFLIDVIYKNCLLYVVFFIGVIIGVVFEGVVF